MKRTSTYRNAGIVDQRFADSQYRQTDCMGRKRGDRERTAFGLRMAAARRHAKLTQVEVREALGVSQGTLSGLEATAQSSGRVVEYAQLYGVDSTWLATGDGPAPGEVARPEPTRATKTAVGAEIDDLFVALGRHLDCVSRPTRRALLQLLQGLDENPSDAVELGAQAKALLASAKRAAA